MEGDCSWPHDEYMFTSIAGAVLAVPMCGQEGSMRIATQDHFLLSHTTFLCGESIQDIPLWKILAHNALTLPKPRQVKTS